jgi:predicted secreted Zn-dependent protease
VGGLVLGYLRRNGAEAFVAGIWQRGLMIVAVCMLVSPALAKPTVTETIEYYDVSGSTPQEVRKELNLLGPFEKTEGRWFDAMTKWNVNWRCKCNNTGKGCGIASAKTEVKVKLPGEPNCDRMGQVANELGRKLVKEANQQDIDYDAKTRHGATQGARFP